MNKKAFSPSIVVAMALLLAVVVVGLAQLMVRNSGLTLSPPQSLNVRGDENLQPEAVPAPAAELSEPLAAFTDARVRSFGPQQAAELSKPPAAFTDARVRNFGPQLAQASPAQEVELSESHSNSASTAAPVRNFLPPFAVGSREQVAGPLAAFTDARVRNFGPQLAQASPTQEVELSESHSNSASTAAPVRNFLPPFAVGSREQVAGPLAAFTDARVRNFGPQQAAELSEPLSAFTESRVRNFGPPFAVGSREQAAEPLSDNVYTDSHVRRFGPPPDYAPNQP